MKVSSLALDPPTQIYKEGFEQKWALPADFYELQIGILLNMAHPWY